MYDILAHTVAADHGFVNEGIVLELPDSNVYEFRHPKVAREAEEPSQVINDVAL